MPGCSECHSPEGHKLSCSRRAGGQLRYSGFRTADGSAPWADLAVDTSAAAASDPSSCDSGSGGCDG